MNTLAEKISYRAALKRLGLLEAFVVFCQARPGATREEIVAWTSAQPGLLDLAVMPESFNALRKQLGCTGARGGLRAVRGKCFLRVQRARKGGRD